MRAVNAMWRRRWRGGLEFLREVWNRIGEDRIPIMAGALSFYTFLSLIPLLLLAVSLAAFFLGLDRQAIAAISENADILGPTLSQALKKQVISIVDNRGPLAAAGIVFGLWAGSQVFVMLESAMNLVWRSRTPRPYLRSRATALFMVFVVGTLFLSSVGLSNAIRFLGSLEISPFGYEIANIPFLVRTLVSSVVPALLVAALFLVICLVLPTRPVSLRVALPGALTAGVLWLLSVHAFGWFASRVADFKFFYGSLSTLVVLMFWFYYNAFIMLMSAEISATYHRRLVEAGDRRERTLAESEQAEEARREWEEFHQRWEAAGDGAVYYGYQHSEWPQPAGKGE